MGETSRNAKVCATCQYWMGYRDISSTGHYVRYREKGQCTSARSSRDTSQENCVCP